MMRTTIGVAGGLLAAVLITFPVALSEFAFSTVVLAAAAGLGFMLALISGRWLFAGPAVLFFFVEYAVALVIDTNRIGLAAPAVGFALLLLLELIDLSSLLARRGPVERASLAARVRYVLLVGGSGGIVSVIGVLAAGWLNTNSYVLVIAGAACGLAAVALTVLLARRAVRPGPV